MQSQKQLPKHKVKEKSVSLLSFLEISRETANEFYTWGWKLSLFGAFVTFCGVTLLMWGTKVRDHDFESNISQLNNESSAANERASHMEKDAAIARLETERLKAHLAWRSISKVEHDTLVKSLSKKPFPVDLEWNEGDLEGEAYAVQIEHALKDAGCDVTTFAVGGTPYVYVGVLGPSKDFNTPDAHAIRKAFHNANIPLQPELGKSAKVTIYVVTKPLLKK